MGAVVTTLSPSPLPLARARGDRASQAVGVGAVFTTLPRPSPAGAGEGRYGIASLDVRKKHGESPLARASGRGDGGEGRERTQMVSRRT